MSGKMPILSKTKIKMTNATAIIADKLELSAEALSLAMIKPATSLRMSDQNSRTMNFITTSSF